MADDLATSTQAGADVNPWPDIPLSKEAARPEGIVPKTTPAGSNVNPWPGEWSPQEEEEKVPIHEAYSKGVQRATEDIFMPKTAAGLTKMGAPRRPSWIDRPYEEEDFNNLSGRLAPKFLYQLGESYPEQIAGAGGFAVAGPIGSGLAIGATHMAHRMSPIYHEELAANPDDPNKAFSNAWKKAGLESAVTGVAGGATSWNPLKNMTRNILLHGTVTQPLSSAAGQAGYNYLEGRPIDENFLAAYGEGLIGSALPTGAYFGGKGVRAAAMAGAKKLGVDLSWLNAQPMTSNEIENMMNHHYDQMSKAGKIPDVNALANEKNVLNHEFLVKGGDPSIEGQDKVFGVLEKMDKGRGALDPDIRDLLNRRKEFRSLIGKGGDVARLAAIGRDYIDKMMGDPERLKALGFDATTAGRIAQSAKPAREMAFIHHQLGEFEQIYDKVQEKSRGNPDLANKEWQRQFQRILHTDYLRVRYSPEVLEGMQRVIDNQAPGWFGIINAPKAFNTAGIGLHLLADMVGGSGVGMGLSAALMAKEMFSRAKAAGLADEAEQVRNLINWQATPAIMRPDLSQPMRKNLTTGARQMLRTPAPRFYPGEPESRGGTIGRAMRVAHQGRRLGG